MTSHAPRLAAVALALALAASAACADDTVRVGFRPPVGDRATYRIVVHATAVTDVGGGPARRSEADDVFEAHHTVLGAEPEGTEVEVRLEDDAGTTTTFVVTLDRAAQLSKVRRIDGLPAEALGRLGVSEIFPAAVAVPPDRRLSPGDRWPIDAPVEIAAATPSRAVGTGRLVALAAVDGRHVATVETTFRLPVERVTESADGQLVLRGSQRTTSTVSYALADGVVESAKARTRGTFAVTVSPPPGVAGHPVPGTLVVDVRSTTRRVG